MVATRRTPAKGKAEPAAKTPAKKSAAGKKGAAGAKLDPDGNEMTPVYYLRQYVGLFFTLLSFAFIAFAGYATQYGFSSANIFLYPGCAIGFVGLALHELRPYKNKAQMTFDPAAVEYRKKRVRRRRRGRRRASKRGAREDGRRHFNNVLARHTMTIKPRRARARAHAAFVGCRDP